MSDKEKFVKLSDVKNKLNYAFKIYGTSNIVKNDVLERLNKLPYSVKAELETTLFVEESNKIADGVIDELKVENAKLEELLKNAVEILDQIAKSNSDICFTGTSCNKCSLYQTDTICKWKYADEALKLIGDDE